MANPDPQAADREVECCQRAGGAGKTRGPIEMPRVEDAYLRVLVGAIPRNDNTGGGVDTSGRMRSQNDDTY